MKVLLGTTMIVGALATFGAIQSASAAAPQPTWPTYQQTNLTPAYWGYRRNGVPYRYGFRPYNPNHGMPYRYRYRYGW